jgi:hypothetical protein
VVDPGREGDVDYMFVPKKLVRCYMNKAGGLANTLAGGKYADAPGTQPSMDGILKNP